ncbi:MAG: RDD family protein [Pseudomonadota bacterium]
MEANELEYVGFGPRLWAFVIDSVLISIVLLALLFGLFGADHLAEGVILTGSTNILFSYVLPAIAVLAFWIIKNATPGKMAIGATIVDAGSGRAPSARQHIIRYIGYFVSTIPLGLGFFWILLDKRKQGWHDKLAGTVVVRRKQHGGEPVKFAD